MGNWERMTIQVICTECESRLTVRDDLLGRKMRCPICSEIFVVALADNVDAPAADEPQQGGTAPRANYITGTVADFVRVLPSESAAEPKVVVWAEGIVPGDEPPPDPAPMIEDVPPPPREVVWSEPELPTPVAAIPFRRRPRRSRLALLIVLVLISIGAVSVGGIFLMRYLSAAPDRMYAQARKDYSARNFEPARNLYEKFSREYPDDPRAAEARFFADLSALRTTVYSVAVKADPAPALAQFDKFLFQAESPAVKPFTEPNRFGVDIWETAVKLTEELTAKGLDAFNRDKPDESVEWFQRADAMGKVVDRFRPKDLPRESILTQIDELGKKIADARLRLEYLAEIRERLIDPDDALIVGVRKELDERGFAADAVFLQLIDQADRKLADRVTYSRLDPPVPSTRDKQTGRAGLLFAPRLDTPRTPLPTLKGTVFFAQFAGILYALDEGDGHVLWAARTGIDSDTLPLTIPATDLHPDLALLTTNDGSKAGLSACLLRTGETFWHQTLPAPAAGQPLLVGQRLFVPLRDLVTKPGSKSVSRDRTGVIVEVELVSGSQIGRIVLGRAIGSPGAQRPGTGQLYFPAEARGIYVFDVEKIGLNGIRVDPVFLGLLPTGHAAGQLLGPPLITAGEGDAGSLLLLTLTDGLDAVRMQPFPLAPVDQAPTLANPLPAAIALPGWPAYPPYADAEKIAVVTDRGTFGLLGIRQAGNLDSPLFVLPTESVSPSGGRQVGRGQLIHADESNFWFLASGLVQQLHLAIDFERGMRLVPRGKPLLLGDPLQAAQVNAHGTLALVVTQSPGDSSCRATAFDLKNGAIRWQRQLGLLAERDPLPVGDGILLLDQAGGLYRIGTASLTGPLTAEWLIDERWLLAAPLADAVGPGYLLPDGEGAIAVNIAKTGAGLDVVVREFSPAKGVRERRTVLPALLAGNPVQVGRSVVLPLANGLLHRLLLDEVAKPFEAGPTWRGDKAPAAAVCRMTAISSDDFLAGDGNRSLVRWHWPADREEFSRKGSLVLGDRVASVPLVLKGKDGPLMLLADANANVTLWNADRLSPTAQPLQTWRPSDKGPILPGKLTSGPFPLAGGNIGYAMDGNRLVRLKTAGADRWEVEGIIQATGKQIVGQPTSREGKILLTFRDGSVEFFDETTGEVNRIPGSQAPAAAGILLDKRRVLLPLADGTAGLVP